MNVQPTNVDTLLARAECGQGYPEELPIPFSALTDSAGAAIAAGTTPELISVNTDFLGAKWDHGDGASHTITGQFTVPNWFAESKYGLQIVARVRKVDTTDENADLKLQAQIYAIGATDTAAKTLTTAALSDALPAAVAGSDTSGFTEVVIDIGAQAFAEGKKLEAGDTVRFAVGPNETVGSSDMDVQLIGLNIRWLRHAGFVDKALRSFGQS